MHVAGLLSGGAPVIKSYQVGASLIAGIPALVAAANGAGLATSTTTSAADMVGVTLDAATYSTTQGTGENSAEALIHVVINPDAIIKARINQGATAGTSLTARTANAASAGGTLVSTGDNWSSPSMDEGIIWGAAGANSGQVRKITSVDTTGATVTVPFDYAVAATTSTFYYAPFWPMQTTAAQLTSDLTEVNNSIAPGTGAAFLTIDVDLNGADDSYVLMVAGDHFLNRLS